MCTVYIDNPWFGRVDLLPSHPLSTVRKEIEMMAGSTRYRMFLQHVGRRATVNSEGYLMYPPWPWRGLGEEELRKRTGGNAARHHGIKSPHSKHGSRAKPADFAIPPRLPPHDAFRCISSSSPAGAQTAASEAKKRVSVSTSTGTGPPSASPIGCRCIEDTKFSRYSRHVLGGEPLKC